MGVSFERPDRYSAWHRAQQDASNKHCYWWDNLNTPGYKPENPECNTLLAKEEQLRQSYENWSPPEFFFVTFQERAGLAAVILGPPLLAYVLGTALFWVCLPLTTRRGGNLREKRGVP